MIRHGSGQTDPPNCATNRIANAQRAIVGLGRFIGMHLCYNLLQRDELTL